MRIDRLMGYPCSVRIRRTQKEAQNTTTIEFDLPHLDNDVQAGQFMMVWVPETDEIPMSISFWEHPIVQITVKRIGAATAQLAGVGVGEWIGVRGPFGNPFSLNSRKAMVVAGGIGIAPLRLLVHSLLDKGAEVTLLVGARTKAELILYDFNHIKNSRFHLEITTDDGSAGKKGYVTTIAEELLASSDVDRLYTCGPEEMMVELHQLAMGHSIKFEASLERYMKCGCGICGTCGMDPTGDLVCIDGPVFSGEHLSGVHDFGRFCRDPTGKKTPL